MMGLPLSTARVMERAVVALERLATAQMRLAEHAEREERRRTTMEPPPEPIKLP